MVPVICPFAPVVPTGCVKLFPAAGVAARTTVAPWIEGSAKSGAGSPTPIRGAVACIIPL